jgi:peptide-methionine (S)-S-oxide reductase
MSFRRNAPSGRRCFCAGPSAPLSRRDFNQGFYSGGEVPNATYRNHAITPAVEIIFDPGPSAFGKLRNFFQIHDPSTLNRQGNDRGAYRSAIFYTSA